MRQPALILKVLTIAAVCDWLVGRTLTRMAIHMPKTPLLITIYQALGYIWQFAAVLSGILALGILFWIAVVSWRKQGIPYLWFPLIGILVFSFAALFFPLSDVQSLPYHLMVVLVLVIFAFQTWHAGARGYASLSQRLAVFIVVSALLVGQLSQFLPGIISLIFPDVSGLGIVLYNTGELLVVLSVFTLWFAYGWKTRWKSWLAAMIPTLVFVLARIADPATTGIIAIWSMGLSLYLPWLVYALALLLASVTAIHALKTGSSAGWAVLLLAAGGYAPQMNTQAVLGVIAVWLLVTGLQPGPQVEQSKENEHAVIIQQEKVSQWI